MAKKHNFIAANLSFEDFEKNLNSSPAVLFAEELVENNLAAEKAAKKKDAELKKAYQRKKRELKASRKP